jgi:hypothetical protein
MLFGTIGVMEVECISVCVPVETGNNLAIIQ